jgi:phage FluMu protein gp41
MLGSLMRLVVSLGLIGGLTVLALQVDVGRVADGCDLFNVPKSLQTISQEGKRGQSLDAQDQVILRRMQTQDQIAKEVLAGRLSLNEAAAQFRVLANDAPYDWDHYRPTHPTWSLERRCCQYVIDHIKGLVMGQEQKYAVRMRELTKEAEECR